MTEQTDAAEVVHRLAQSFADECAFGCASMSSGWVAHRDDAEALLAAREAVAEARGAERALREAAEALNAEPDSRSCTQGTDEAVRIVEWLRARAAAARGGA